MKVTWPLALIAILVLVASGLWPLAAIVAFIVGWHKAGKKPLRKRRRLVIVL